ncbi:MAG: ABC transporter ATP-binding protein [Alphaproteobacteria bacterium]|nr:ABC transporter ATP-binding protein [Alphaproteobacteria bacterium]
MQETASVDGRADAAPSVIRIRGLRTQFGPQVIHDGLDLDVQPGEVIGVVGGSGTGKSVLLRTIIGLQQPAAGEIRLLGQDIQGLSDTAKETLRTRTGVLFQDGALFSSLTVAENIQAPMREHTDLSQDTMDELAALKIAMVGLPPNSCGKYPSELSGGMRKRAGLARALSLDPEIVFLDEPTAGLDPIGAAAFDQLILSLQKSLGLTVFMVTHDLDSLAAICDRIAALIDKRIRIGTMADHMSDDDPWLTEYFHGPRARAAQAAKSRATELGLSKRPEGI